LARSNGGRLTIARSVDVPSEEWLWASGTEMADRLSGLRTEQEAELLALARGVAPGVEVGARLLWGPPIPSVIDAVRERGYDLVMKEAEDGRGTLFGGGDRQLMRRCPCPVWLFDPERSVSFGSVLAAVDVSSGASEELNAAVIQVASSLASREGAALHAVHAWSLHAESLLRSRARGSQRARLRSKLRATKAKRREQLVSLLEAETATGVVPEWHLVKGPATAGIRRVAGEVDADVVVMGTLGRAGLQGLLIGNTAEAVLSLIDCSVLTVKPPGLGAPVREATRLRAPSRTRRAGARG
jgi:nucleotide-binding universal stress UspA family protein